MRVCVCVPSSVRARVHVLCVGVCVCSSPRKPCKSHVGSEIRGNVCLGGFVYVGVCVCVCVRASVCVHERERESEDEGETEREGKRKRERARGGMKERLCSKTFDVGEQCLLSVCQPPALYHPANTWPPQLVHVRSPRVSL